MKCKKCHVERDDLNAGGYCQSCIHNAKNGAIWSLFTLCLSLGGLIISLKMLGII